MGESSERPIGKGFRLRHDESYRVFKVIDGLKKDAEREGWTKRTWIERIHLELKDRGTTRVVPTPTLTKSLKAAGIILRKNGDGSKAEVNSSTGHLRIVARQLANLIESVRALHVALAQPFDPDGKFDVEKLRIVSRGKRMTTPVE